MKRNRIPAVLSASSLALVTLTACDPRSEAELAATPTPESAAATPAATPEPPGLSAAPEVEPEPLGDFAGPVETVETVDLDPETLENKRIREEVLARIDVMPNLSESDKDRLYVQVERARGMGRVITIPFPSGATRIPAGSLPELGASLEQPQVKTLTDDPTVVFVVLGFADRTGDPARNLDISRQRAESALAAIRERFGILNVMHAVGMGSSEMFDADDLDKNRVVEVWAVLP